MNGRVAKRIRIAATIISETGDFKPTVQRLKREYLALPYHRRTEGAAGIYRLSHSALLNLVHASRAHNN